MDRFQLRKSSKVLAQLQAVHKRFGQTEALKGVDLELRQGEIMALLGPNGAGKTTAISVILGRRRPDRGKAWLFGADPRLPKARSQIGATPQETGFPKTLTLGEVVDLVRSHYPNPLSLAEVLGRFGLLGLERRQTGGLSGGQQRRLAVALAFAGNPKAVFLDEPTTGLDVESRRSLWQAIRKYVQDGGTVLLTTHHMEEAEELAMRVVVINQGQVVAEGSVEKIKARVGLKQVRFRSDVVPELSGIAGVERKEGRDGAYTLYTANADELVRGLVRQEVPFKELEVLPVSLEEAFLVLTGGEKR